MKLFSINTGNFKLDGGAIFGVVPKTIWSNWYVADDKNLVNLCMRCLLIQDGDKNILVDTGMGDKQDEKFLSYYYLNGDDSLEKSLQQYNFSTNDITDVVLTHLHFDHVGGAVKREDNDLKLTFKNATYHVSADQWKCAMQPNKREKASYFKENLEPLEQSGHLKLWEEEGNITENVELRFFNGHTKGLIIPVVKYGLKTIVYMADLIPLMGNIPIPYICAYDTQPLVSMDEKESFLEEALNNNYILYFEHDLENECCNLVRTEKGIRANDSFSLQSVL